MAVAPSFTVRDALSAATVGATFELPKCANASCRLPFVPADEERLNLDCYEADRTATTEELKKTFDGDLLTCN